MLKERMKRLIWLNNQWTTPKIQKRIFQQGEINQFGQPQMRIHKEVLTFEKEEIEIVNNREKLICYRKQEDFNNIVNRLKEDRYKYKVNSNENLLDKSLLQLGVK
ncbi:unnamed protein product (macronuclear) [Paramecium tetraurelia]|uniref:Uncharacterized protein n=1 Tax=Paramecium tetraurelia TaxID=5888 RepID=A0BMK8_PARTE|nr:uncharacterized protein GSPATT00030411001 [Paramecium tetraurelia]CAK59775.1 unnamed protein product [Paramecium tetraurelia]|eukprot:XP_001427173.1 hypothetical protein (macronuclear) [Paramecium tetraurelia strain d4-2]